MTARQRFILTIVLATLVIVGIIGTVVSFALDSTNAASSPAVTFISGTGTAVILVLISMIQNQSIQQTVTETKTIVNGGLQARVTSEVHTVLAELGLMKEHVLVPVPLPSTVTPPANETPTP